jgi:hypothetical protein
LILFKYFNPEDNLTREEIVAIFGKIGRFFENKFGFELLSGANNSNFGSKVHFSYKFSTQDQYCFYFTGLKISKYVKVSKTVIFI